MAKSSFLTDEHIPNAVMRGRRARGIDASTVGEAGQLGASDTALLAFAKAQGRILITADADHPNCNGLAWTIARRLLDETLHLS